MFALSPKSYYTICHNTGTVKEGKKGIPKWFDLRKRDFEQTLYGANPTNHCVEVKSLRLDKQRHMKRTTTIRKGLTAIHVKLSVQPDKITCLPLSVDGKYV